MKIEVDKWEPTSYLTSSTASDNVLGKARVVLAGNFYVWMTVKKGKWGRKYATFPAVKVGDEFRSLIGWIDGKHHEKAISEVVINILINKKVI